MRREVDPGFDGTPKANPNPQPGIAHDFGCTHDPCRCPKYPLVFEFGQMGPGIWCANGFSERTHKVVPLSARVVEDDGRKRVLIEADENGEWPDGAPLRAASDAYRNRMKQGGLPIAALEVFAVQGAVAAYLDAVHALAEGGSE